MTNDRGRGPVLIPGYFGSLPALKKEQATRFIELRMAA
jgi:hypothetical protein